MMTSIQSYVRRGRHLLKRWSLDPGFHSLARGTAQFLAGFLLTAASLGNEAHPIALGLLCAVSGWSAVRIALGGMMGYVFFWGRAGYQGILWLGLGLPCALLLGERRISRDVPLLLPSIAGLIVSASGVIFQNFLSDDTTIPIFLLRVALGASTARLFALVLQRRDPIANWLACGTAVLALAQVAPVPYLGLGFTAAGALGAAGAFPAAAVAGLALDLAKVTRVPMSAVLCLAYLVRLLPWKKRWAAFAAPGAVFLLVSALCGVWDMQPLPGLALGGLLGAFLPAQQRVEHRRGETGVAQVRLEMAAACLAQTQQLLLEAPTIPIDESALIARAAERACGSCPCRKSCRDRESAGKLPPQLLHRPLLDASDLDSPCRKSGRLVSELHRSQEQLRSIRADRARQKEYRGAVVQQYHFLANYLQDLADQLPQRGKDVQPRYVTKVAVCSNRREEDNGDRCLWFAGTECKYYILLCDGMGTGLGAIDEGNTAGKLLKQLLSAGFPAEHALRSLNSLCALRDRAGAVTIDLAEIALDTGRVTLYKWGAAPSYLVTTLGTEKIGTAGPPPGLSATEGRETVERLSLRRGETLVLVSDGVGGEDALRGCGAAPDEPPGETAARFLELGGVDAGDDATAAAIRLYPADLAT